jgi:hypothetical protein
MVPISAFVDFANLMRKRKIAVWFDVQSKNKVPTKWEPALKLGAD